MRRLITRAAGPAAAFERRLHRAYGLYTAGVVLFVLVMLVVERLGVPRDWIGMAFVSSSLLLYAAVGMRSRTSDPTEYYVAGHRVPPLYNGMAAAADWMSVASYMGLAGTLYLSGFGGLAYVLGWTGGFCLLALFIAPFLRRLGQYTVSDFLVARFPGRLTRLVVVCSIVLCSFSYVVAQIYGVGLITASLTGLDYQLGVFAGVSGVLLCSFLGGMRAVTWTQVAQCILMVGAYMVPVVWLAWSQTGSPLPQWAYGPQIDKLSAIETRLLNDPSEAEARRLWQERAESYSQKLARLPDSLREERESLQARALERQLGAQFDDSGLAPMPRTSPKTEAEARLLWAQARENALRQASPLAGMQPHAQPYRGDPQGREAERTLFDLDRRNFLALVFCLTLGTAALPHLLIRFNTTPSVAATRRSVVWTLFFILLLYLTAPALAVLVKYEVFAELVGSPIADLPSWLGVWNKVDPNLVSVTDINQDGVLQLAELRMAGDILTLATPAIAGLPYVVTCLVAVGGLAAALSTADGLLLTIANTIALDLHGKVLNRPMAMTQRIALSKIVLMLLAMAAAAVAVHKPGDILFLVSASFSLAASALFPALVLAVAWSRATAAGATAGMLTGLGVAVGYLVVSHPPLRQWVGLDGAPSLWWGIQPASAGVFGVPAGLLTIVVVSWLTPPPAADTQDLVERLRHPAGPDAPG